MVSEALSPRDRMLAKERSGSDKDKDKRKPESFADFTMVKLRHWVPVKGTACVVRVTFVAAAARRVADVAEQPAAPLRA